MTMFDMKDDYDRDDGALIGMAFAVAVLLLTVVLLVVKLRHKPDTSQISLALQDRQTVALERLEAAFDVYAVATERERADRVYICKRLPQIGQPEWGEWIKTNGGCVQIDPQPRREDMRDAVAEPKPRRVHLNLPGYNHR